MLSNPYEEIERLRELCGIGAGHVGCLVGPCEDCPLLKTCNEPDKKDYIKLKEASEEK